MTNQPNEHSTDENESSPEEPPGKSSGTSESAEAPQETSSEMIGKGKTPDARPEEESPSRRPGQFSPEVWSALQSPFDPSAVKLVDLQLDTKYKRGLARPVVSESALLRRLNGILGPEGWSVEFTPEGPETCRCRLHVGSAFRDAIAEGTGRLDTCLQAFRLAAREFGIAAGLHGPPNIYVEKDENDNITNFDQIIEDLREAGAVR